jgi:asparagine synthase (glutamine-hydrolysing)
MCGIAGIATIDPRRGGLDSSPIRSMLTCLKHRGPDDEGEFVADGVVIGHRRLSVIDVAGGHQPLYGARDTTVIVVNGEIYNYRELAKELSARGHRFRTASDSEVAAHAYDEWGLDFLHRMDGMFALALWDAERRQLVLARDRMGEKPLYYTVAGNELIFASELTSIILHPAVKRELDPEALSAYLALEYVPAPRTILRNIYKLEPASALVLENGDMRVSRYWAIEPRSTFVKTYKEAVTLLRERLEHAVVSRLVSDVPLGVFLSGGLDSSTVAAIAAKHGALETFSIGFREKSFDESSYARMVAAHIGSRHHERIFDGAEMPALVPKLAQMLDEPLGDASILPTALLSAFARERVTVAIGGDGGDELFAGYPMHQAQRAARYARRVPAAFRRAIGTMAGALPVSHGNFSPGFKIKSFLRGAGEPAPMNHALWMSSFNREEQRALLREDVWRAGGEGEHAFADVVRAWEQSGTGEPLARATHLDAMMYLPNDILTKVDRASMRVALEVRAPFLARDVVELAFSVPDSFRMKGTTGKRMLRDAVKDLLPPSILGRPKKGFGIPVAAWLNGPLREMVRDTFARDVVARAGLFEHAEIQRMLDAHAARKADYRKPLWTLLVFELWRREYLA